MAKARAIAIDYIKKQMVTPAVEVAYTYLSKPDTKFGEDKAKYKLTATLPKDFVDKMIEVDKQYRAENDKPALKKAPAWLKEDDAGNLSVCFKSGTPVSCVDAKVKKIDPGEVWSGSVCKVQIQPGWCETGVYKGMVWYLQGVQMLKKGEGSRGNLFETEEEYLTDDDTNPEIETFNVEDTEVELDEEDLLV